MPQDLSVTQSSVYMLSQFITQGNADLCLRATAAPGSCLCAHPHLLYHGQDQGAAVAYKHCCPLAQLSACNAVKSDPCVSASTPNSAHVLLQVSLYLLLMQERYGHVIESGLLWYLSHSSPQQVKLVPQELQSLMQARNWLAAALVPGQPLPSVIRDERACDKCFQKTVCALSHKVRLV